MSFTKSLKSDCIPVIEYPGGVLCVDSGFTRDRMASCYVLEAEQEVAIIETGTNSSVGRLVEVIKQRGWSRSAVKYIIVTHVHLDHAGGAGQLMQEFPQATFLVHPAGAAHMIDPSKLEASVRRVYGDKAFDADYGKLIPIDAGRVREMSDGEEIRLGNRTLEFMDTPGHARHHFCVWDSLTKGWFSGDTFGLSYRDLDTVNGVFIFPTTTPIEFDPGALKQSITKLIEKKPTCIYLTHFGRIGGVSVLSEKLISGVDVIVQLAEKHVLDDEWAKNFKADFQDWLLTSARAHGVTMSDDDLKELLMIDIDLNTQGVEVWLKRLAKKKAG